MFLEQFSSLKVLGSYVGTLQSTTYSLKSCIREHLQQRARSVWIFRIWQFQGQGRSENDPCGECRQAFLRNPPQKMAKFGPLQELCQQGRLPTKVQNAWLFSWGKNTRLAQNVGRNLFSVCRRFGYRCRHQTSAKIFTIMVIMQKLISGGTRALVTLKSWGCPPGLPDQELVLTKKYWGFFGIGPFPHSRPLPTFKFWGTQCLT